MADSATQQAPAGRHCQRVDAGARWVARDAPPGTFSTTGEDLAIAIRVFAESECLAQAAGSAGEEVAAVLEGVFRIDAAGERYELSPGEAIIIPPGEPRAWTCLSPRGVLYRAVTHVLQCAAVK